MGPWHLKDDDGLAAGVSNLIISCLRFGRQCTNIDLYELLLSCGCFTVKVLKLHDSFVTFPLAGGLLLWNSCRHMTHFVFCATECRSINLNIFSLNTWPPFEWVDKVERSHVDHAAQLCSMFVKDFSHTASVRRSSSCLSFVSAAAKPDQDG